MLKYGNVTRNPADLERAATICEQTLHWAPDIVIITDLDYLLSRPILRRYKPTGSNDDLAIAANHSTQAFNWTPEDRSPKQQHLENMEMMESIRGSRRELLPKNPTNGEQKPLR